MDDVNINKICLGIEEVQLDEDDEEWIKLNWISNQSDNDGNFQSPETQRDLANEIAQRKDYESTVSLTNTESDISNDDISDGISVITESDTDAVNTNLFQICQFNRTPYKSPQMMEVQINKQKDIWNILVACVLGIIIGLALNHLFTIPETCPVSNEVDIESVKLANHNIVNTCKELTNVKIILNEIKTHMPTDRKIAEQFLTQFFEITDSNKTNSKPVMVTKEFFNFTPHPFDQLQVSLHVLSSLAFIYDDNSSLRNDINKTLNIVNNTKIFYETLVLYTNNTQNVSDFIILNSLQPNSDKIHITSKLLLSNLAEKVSKITSKVYNKYTKERHRLNKELCHLKSILPDDKLLKQLTENNQLFKDYDKSCFSHYTSKHLDDRTITKSNTKTKEHITKTDDTVLHTKYDKKNTHKIHHNDKENFLKSKRNKRQSVDKSIMFFRNTSHKIHKASQLLLSKILENIGKLKYKLSKKLHHLKNILANNSEFLKQLIEDDEQDTKESKLCEGKNDNLQSNITPKNSFDNILMQLKNTCPLSTNYCPKFNINMSTFDTVPNHKTKNYKHKKHDANSKKTVINQENSAKWKNKSKKKNHFKSNGFTKKDINNKANYERENISFQNKINNISEHTVNYHKSKHSLFDSRTMKQDNQHYTNTDRIRSYEYRKQRRLDDSDWYFQRVRSRRNARRQPEQRRFDNSDWYFQRVRSRRNARKRTDMYQQNIKWFWKNRR